MNEMSRTVQFINEAHLQDVLAAKSVGAQSTYESLKREFDTGVTILVEVPGMPLRTLALNPDSGQLFVKPSDLNSAEHVDTESDAPLTPDAQGRLFFQLLGEMDPDTRLAFEKLMVWLAERPEGSAQLNMEQMEQMIEEIRLENIRRRLGGKVGEVRIFKTRESKE